MKQMICLADSDWSASPGRTQQLVGRLKDVEVLYFVPARGLFDRSYRKRGRRVRPHITVYTLPPVLEVPEDLHLAFALEQRRQAAFVSPDWEGGLAQAADVVFAASPSLADRLSPCSNNIALLPYGHTFALFAQCPPPPAGNPVLGYAGTLWPDLDLWPVLYAAQRHPDWRFLLIGRRKMSKVLAKLDRLPNVGLTGRLEAREVPRYVAQCHVLLDLRRTDREEDILSPRLYEYLTTGRPIVSMVEEEQVEVYPDVIYAAHSPEEFERMCVKAVQEPPGWASRRRREHGESAAWSQRSAQVSLILNTAGLL